MADGPTEIVFFLDIGPWIFVGFGMGLLAGVFLRDKA